ncbi:hypothetical protein SDC9_72323 [bioreactor metagenome]|uniref:Uncharacterized protein n=1 Tax=bioreactor metagenome TaxID=1076179 RepID=A0A644YH68_9ZZZZ
MLAPGVADKALVPAQYPARFVHKVTIGRRMTQRPLDKGGIITIGSKADILTVPLFGVDQPVLLRNLPDLCFVETAQGKQGAAQLVLRQHVKKIALVLAAVQAALQKPAARIFVLFHSGIMTRGQELTVERQRPLEQRPELYGPIADNTGIGRSPRLILRYEIRNYRIPENL